MGKCVVYSGTRNLYEAMIPPIKSLLKNTSVDRVYVLIEDDKFPYYLPPECEVINVSAYKEMFKDSVNFNCAWTYMVLLRTAYTKVFPHLDKVLSMDVDTIVNHEIAELWDIDMTGYYIAGCKEYQKTKDYGRLYLNAGVMMYNLKELRESGMDDRLIEAVIKNEYKYVEQDCFFDMLKGHMLEIDPNYNRAIGVTLPTQDPKVFHFAAHKERLDYREVQRYAKLTWREVR